MVLLKHLAIRRINIHLAMNKVRFIGEEVAAVAATDLYAADEGAESYRM